MDLVLITKDRMNLKGILAKALSGLVDDMEGEGEFIG
jgi:hypothetical protein